MAGEAAPKPMDQHLSPANSSSSQNGTIAKDDTGEFPYIIILPILIVVVGLVGNLLVFMTTAWSKRIKMHQHAFLLSLAVADSLCLGLVMPFTIKVIVDGGWTSGDAACNFQGYLMGLTCHASLVSIASIAINRYVSVVHIAYYKTIYTPKNIKLIIVGVWTFSLLLPFPTQVGWGRIAFSELTEACLYDWDYSPSYTYTILTVGFLLPALLVVYCYLKIWLKFRESRRKVLRRRNTVQPLTVHHATIRKEDLRLAAQLVALFLVFVICWAPYLILAALVDPHGNGERLAYDITANLLLLNSIIDPVFYFFFNATLRTEAVGLFRWMFCLPEQGPPNGDGSRLDSSSRF